MEEKKLILSEEELLNTAGGLTAEELTELRSRLEDLDKAIAYLPIKHMESTDAGTFLVMQDGSRTAIPASAATIALASGKTVVVMKASDMSKDLADELGLTR